jgi:hypothetical protein
MIDITWQPAYTIKAYPELCGLFGRGENHLLAYLHNWAVQLTKKGKAQDPEWVFLTQQQIAEAIDYSVSSVKRFIQQINQKVEDAIQVRSRPVYLTRFFSYTVYEYRVNWQKVTAFLAAQNVAADLPENARMAQSSHLHFERGVAQNKLGVAQNELTYKDPFKDPINIKTPPLPLQREAEKAEKSECLNTEAAIQIPESQTTHPGLIQPLEKIQDISGGRSSAAAEKMNSLTPQQAASMGLVRAMAPDGSQTWVESPAGRVRGQSTWIQQGIALGLWENKDFAIEFQGQVAQYARNQDWCKSPLDYTNSVIKGLLAGDNPKADRYWEAWRNGHPIGWENLFDWEVQPGVINPAFSNWVSTQLFDSTKQPASNAAIAAKELKFSARALWARFQREVAREVKVADEHQQRGQTYLPPGALLPRPDQPTSDDTHGALNRLMGAAVAVRPEVYQMVATSPLLVPQPQPQLAQALEPEITAQEFMAIQPERGDILAKMELIGTMGGRSAPSRIVDKSAQNYLIVESDPEFNNEVENEWICQQSLTDDVWADSIPEQSNDAQEQSPLDSEQKPSTPPKRPLTVELLPEAIAKRKQLELQWRRKKPPYDLGKAAKYMVWAQKGDEAMQQEAIAWLEANDPMG